MGPSCNPSHSARYQRILERFGILDFTFPQNHDLPTCQCKKLLLTRVAFDGRPKLSIPKINSR